MVSQYIKDELKKIVESYICDNNNNNDFIRKATLCDKLFNLAIDNNITIQTHHIYNSNIIFRFIINGEYVEINIRYLKLQNIFSDEI